MNTFTERFNEFVIWGDSISVETSGFTITARVVTDDSHIDYDDVHNIDQSVTGCNDEQQKVLLANRKAWFDGEWFYCGIVLKVSKGGVVLCDYAASLWGIEANYPRTDNSYLLEVANELLPEAIGAGELMLSAMNAANK